MQTVKKTNNNNKNYKNNNNAKKYEYQERLYITSLLEMNIALYPNQIGENKTRENLQKIITNTIEGKCIREGYVQPKSVRINHYSSGIVKGELIEFNVVFVCNTSNPVEGTHIQCTVKSVTKAGIHAEAFDSEGNIPISLFVARDHFVKNPQFQKVKETDVIMINVIGTRFEMNDDCIEVLGELITPKKY
jgi:DNA-directed RNA polymerase subunit E'/Rpb7